MATIRLQNLLKPGGGDSLNELVRQAEKMDRLTAGLKAGLAPDLAPYLVAANLRQDGTLVLIAESPAWAARLRFEMESLVAIARQAGLEVSSGRVIVSKERTAVQDRPPT
jgi:hypothetical protein